MALMPARSHSSHVLAIAIALVALPAFGAPVGFVMQMQGIVQVQPENATSWQPAAIDGGVSVGESIRTEANSAAKILLVDDTIISVAENTEIYIDRMIVGDLATQERSILRQMVGQVRAQVGKAFGGTTRLEIHTPTAIVGVRGSTMNVRVENLGPGNGWVTVAAIQAGDGFACSDSGCVDLQAGQATTIPEVGSPGAPRPIPPGFDAVFDALGGGTQQVSTGPENVNIDSQLGFGPAGVGAGAGPGGGGGGLVEQQALDPTNSTGQSVGPAESFEDGPVAGGGANNPSQFPGPVDPSPPLFSGDVTVETPGPEPPLFGGDVIVEAPGTDIVISPPLFGGGGTVETPGSDIVIPPPLFGGGGLVEAPGTTSTIGPPTFGNGATMETPGSKP